MMRRILKKIWFLILVVAVFMLLGFLGTHIREWLWNTFWR